jgi:hypothetical protein
LAQFRVFDEDALKTFECFFKHLCAVHELGWEYVTTIVSPQLANAEGNVDDLAAKLNLVSSVTGDVEELLEAFVNEFLLKNVAVATNHIRVNREDLAQFIWQYGHLVCGEEHLADYVKKYVGELQNVKSDEERRVVQEKILLLSNFLYTARLIRKKYLTGFLQKLAKPEEKTSLPEASDFKNRL